MAAGELVAFARQWPHGRVPGVLVRALSDSLAEIEVRPFDGPPTKKTLSLAGALVMFERWSAPRPAYESEVALVRPEKTDPHRGP